MEIKMTFKETDEGRTHQGIKKLMEDWKAAVKSCPAGYEDASEARELAGSILSSLGVLFEPDSLYVSNITMSKGEKVELNPVLFNFTQQEGFEVFKWIPEKFFLNTVKYYLEMDEKDIEPGIHYAVNSIDPDVDFPVIRDAIQRVLQNKYETRYAGAKTSKAFCNDARRAIMKICRDDENRLQERYINTINIHEAFEPSPAIWGALIVHKRIHSIQELVAIRTVQINTKNAVKIVNKKYEDILVTDGPDYARYELGSMLEHLSCHLRSDNLVKTVSFRMQETAIICIDWAITTGFNSVPHIMRWYGGMNATREFFDLENIFG